MKQGRFPHPASVQPECISLLSSRLWGPLNQQLPLTK